MADQRQDHPQLPIARCTARSLARTWTGTAAEGASRMNLGSHLVQRMLRLDPPLTRDLVIERDLRVPMPDGVVLLANRWAPRAGGEALPTALLRSPYGRRGAYRRGDGQAAGRTRLPGADPEHPRHVRLRRGLRPDAAASATTAWPPCEWLVKQPWFGGSIVLSGASYLGYVQWTVADELPPEVKAMIPQVTESALTLEFLRPDGLFAGDAVRLGRHGRRPGTPRRDAAAGRAGQADAPGAGHDAARRGRYRRRRAPRRLHPGHPGP